MTERFEIKDHVLPIVQLEDPVKIILTITDDLVELHIGPRDLSWNRKTGKPGDSGTFIGHLGSSQRVVAEFAAREKRTAEDNK